MFNSRNVITQISHSDITPAVFNFLNVTEYKGEVGGHHYPSYPTCLLILLSDIVQFLGNVEGYELQQLQLLPRSL